MNKKLIWIIAIVVVVALVVWGVGFGSKKGDLGTGKPIKIGAVIALTGAGAANGQDIQRGMDLAKKDLAARGVAIDITYQDDQTNPKESVSAVQQILATGKPDAIVGPIWSFLLDAALPVTEKAQVVTFSPCSSSEYINTKTAYAFFGYVRNSLKDVPTSAWVKEIGAKNVAVIVSKDAWGDSNEKAFVKGITDASAKVVMIERVPFGGEVGVLPTILAKAKASKADALIWTGYDDGASVLLKKLHDLKFGVPVLGTDALKSVTAKGVVKLNADERMYVYDTPKSDVFSEKFKKAYNVAPGECADTAYDGVMIIAEAVQKRDGMPLADYLRSRTNYSGYAHSYDFDSTGDVSGGEWVIRKLK